MKKRILRSAFLIGAWLIALWPTLVLAQPIKNAQAVGDHTVRLTYQDGRTLILDFYGPNVLRLFSDPAGGELLRLPQADPPANMLVAQPRKDVAQVDVEDIGTAFAITTSDVRLTFNKQRGLLSATDQRNGRTVLQEVQPAEFGENKVTLRFALSESEYPYGGGVQNGRFSHRGQSIAIENTNNWVDGGVASPTPFYWTTAGYAFMWHTFKAGRYDFGATTAGVTELSHNEAYLDVFLMFDETPVALLNDFYQLTGHPVLLPKFGFYEGHLNAYNRDYWTRAEQNGFMAYEDGYRYNESQSDNGGIRESLNGEIPGGYQFSARAAIDRYLNADMPLGWFLPNDGYGAGYGQTNTLEGNIENLRQFGEYAHSKGVEIGLWTQSDLHPKEGIEPLLQRDIIGEVGTAGVRVLKTDVAWVGAGYSFGLNGVADVGEVMPRYGNDARPFIISLDGWAGTQRYAGIWTGDQTGGDWEYIRYHIPTFIGAGLSGQPNITNDVDGIFGGKNVPVNIREYQWKTFTPMELNMDGWGSNPKYPQVLGEPAASFNRTYLKLKSALLPYTYSIARAAVDGKPIIRAMFLDYPNAYTYGKQTQYQYMYGPYLLVAPVYKNTAADALGNDIRNGIYLPEGRWTDIYTGETYVGGRILNTFDAPLWKLPVLVTADAIIPMTRPHNTPAQAPNDYRKYVIYALQGTQFTEYDDDGRTQAYLRGSHTATNVSTCVTGNGTLTVEIAPTVGAFQGFEPKKQTDIVVNVGAAPRSVKATIGKKKVKLRQLTREQLEQATQGWAFSEDEPQLTMFMSEGEPSPIEGLHTNPRILIKLPQTDVTANAVRVNIEGFTPLALSVPSTDYLPETLPAPSVTMKEIGAYSVTPQWQSVAGAKYYEIAHDGIVESTIRTKQFTLEDLTPESPFTFSIRAVGNEAVSPWTIVEVTTAADPLKWAVNGVTGITTFKNQGGQEIAKLFDRDEKTMWHSDWSTHDATGGDLTIDLHSVNELASLVYLPREDGGNGIITRGTYSISSDKLVWSTPVAFTWARDSEQKVITFADSLTARYIRLHIDESVGGFASGRELYVFRREGTEGILQGDINRDKRIDENDLTSYMNYTGLRRGDGDFEYVSIGDINANGLIDAYDISVVTTQLDGGVRESNDHVAGKLVLQSDKAQFAAGDEVRITVSGTDLHYVNGLSFALPYDASLLEYTGLELVGMKNMVNLTNDRLHTNGTKALYPTFVNRGNDFLLDEGNQTLFVIKFRAKKAGSFNFQAQDGLLIDRNLGTANPF
ncbi:MAG: discoidin domain-containing protein [Bacteroidaceae bacterium]|nr:discoidin domain-containing protein [Bacteroidaceae bacterium]